MTLPIHVQLAIEVEDILSENKLYAPFVAGKSVRFRLTDEARVLKKSLEEQMVAEVIRTDLKKHLEDAIENIGALVCDCNWFFFLMHGTLLTVPEKSGAKRGQRRWLMRRDVTNMVKGMEDSVFKILGLDDSIVRVSRAQKIPVKFADEALNMNFRPVIMLDITVSKLNVDETLICSNPPRPFFRVSYGEQ